MIIIGVDFHPGLQHIVAVDMQTGELQERRLKHPEEAERFYRELAASVPVRIGMEASGHARWFERLMAELQIELWIGDAAEILSEWRRPYFHLMMRRGRKIAKVAMARRLAICLCWMLRQGWDCQQWVEYSRRLRSAHGASGKDRTPR